MTIPEDVLDRIVAHRPHLGVLVANLRAAPAHLVPVLEKRLADAYLAGESRLTPQETWNLAACSAGRGYGRGCRVV